MRDIYPAYRNRVGFIGVGVDPTESPSLLKQTADSRGYPWSIAAGTSPMLRRFQVVQTSIKFAVNREGIITFQAGYGVGDDATWRGVFEGLVSS